MPTTITTAFVLAAGLGSRMRHLTQATPKPLIEVAGRSLLDRVLDGLVAAGVNKAVVNVHYLADQIETHLAQRDDPAIVISDERGERLETGGGVKHALLELGAAPFLIQNADCFWLDDSGANIARLCAAWDPARMDALLLLTHADAAIGYDGRGDFDSDADGRLQRRQPEHSAPFVFAGASIAAPALFDDAPDGPFSLNVVWDRALVRGRLYGVAMAAGTWMHVGTPEAVADAERRLAQ
ncbi:MAG: nucleotidyltransferase family protein [Pseudomonadota bacterium]